MAAFEAMLTFYDSLPKGERLLLALPARDASNPKSAVERRL
jgi:hypothetical protein